MVKTSINPLILRTNCDSIFIFLRTLMIMFKELKGVIKNNEEKEVSKFYNSQ